MEALPTFPLLLITELQNQRKCNLQNPDQNFDGYLPDYFETLKPEELGREITKLKIVSDSKGQMVVWGSQMRLLEAYRRLFSLNSTT